MSSAGERRTITVLFSDLSGFTALSEQMDPEDLRDLVDQLFRRFRTIIESAGGTVDKFIGDAVMALFGAPVAHPDDPLRAVRCALAMQRELGAYNAERKLALAMRVGVNTGDVLWGSVGGAAPTAMGDAVNVAQRLEGAATPGTVLVAEATAREVRRRVRCEARGPVQVKGRHEPVETLEAIEEIAEATAPIGVDLPIRGREAVLARLAAALETGGLFLIEGEAGIGKTRLLAELRRLAREKRAARVATGRAPEGGRIPLGPFAEIARTLAGATADGARLAAAVAADLQSIGADEAENLGHLVAMSIGLPVPGARVAGLDPERRAAEMPRAWAAWLRSKTPALFCLEDLHAADDATLALLAALPPHLAGSAVTLAASARLGAAAPAGFERVVLDPLAPEALRSLAETAAGHAVDDRTARFLAEQSGGNPLYAEELVRFLAEAGLLSALHSGPPPRLPSGLQGLLVARLDALPAEVKDTLKAAAAVGRSFWPGVLVEVAGAAAGPALEQARRRGLAGPRADSLLPGESQWDFRHALVRDAAYGLLTKKDRTALHASIATVLQARAPTAGRRALALAAEQRLSSGEGGAAAALWLSAARAAMPDAPAECLDWSRAALAAQPGVEAATLAAEACADLSRFPEAVECAEAAERIGGSDPGGLARARLAAAKARLRTGPHEAARALARQVLESPAEEVRLAEAAVLEAQAVFRIGRIEESLALARAALERARALPSANALPHSLVLSARASVAQALLGLGKYDDATGMYTLNLESARSQRRPAQEAEALNSIGICHFQQGHYGKAAETYELSIAISRRLGDRQAVARLLTNLGGVWRNQGDPVKARTALEEAMPIWKESGDLTGQVAVHSNLGGVLTGLSDFEGGLREYAASLDLARKLGDGGRISGALNNLGMTLDTLGRYGEALEAYQESLALRRKMNDPAGLARVLSNIGLIHELQGRTEESREALEESLALHRGIRNVEGEASVLINIAHGRVAAGDYRGALDALAVSKAYYISVGHNEAASECLHEEGLAFMNSGNHDGAEARLLESLELSRKAGDRYGAARSHGTLGVLLHRRGKAGPALSEYDAALALQREIGDRAGEATTLHRMSLAAAALGDMRRSDELNQGAHDIFRAIGHLPGIAGCLEIASYSRNSQGRSAEGLPPAEEALELRRRIGSPEGIAKAQAYRINILAALGRHDEAAAAAKEVLEIRERLGEPRLAARARTDLADQLRIIGRFAEARSLVQAAIPVLRDRGASQDLGAALATLAALHADAGDWQAALAPLEEACALAEKGGDPRGEARALSNTGAILECLGAAKAALEATDRALAAYRATRTARGVVHTCRQRARLLAALGEWDAAEAAASEALRLHESGADPDTLAATLRAASETAWLRGREDEARALAGRAVNLNSQAAGQRASCLAWAAWALASTDPEGARRRGAEALEVAGQEGRRESEVLARAAQAVTGAGTLESARAVSGGSCTFRIRLVVEEARAMLLLRSGDLPGAARVALAAAATARDAGAPGWAAPFERLAAAAGRA